MWRLIKRNPLRIVSFLYGWIIGKIYIDKSPKLLPILLETPFLGVRIVKHKNAKFEINGRLVVDKRGTPVAFKSPTIEIYEDAELIINNKVIISPNTHIIVGRGGKLIFGDIDDTTTSFSFGCKIVADRYIKIGSACTISWEVLIMDTPMHSINGKNVNQPVIIGKNTWIMARATILKGVEIGEKSAVATGAVVTKSFPPHTFVGGNPAQVLDANISWDLA